MSEPIGNSILATQGLLLASSMEKARKSLQNHLLEDETSRQSLLRFCRHQLDAGALASDIFVIRQDSDDSVQTTSFVQDLFAQLTESGLTGPAEIAASQQVHLLPSFLLHVSEQLVPDPDDAAEQLRLDQLHACATELRYLRQNLVANNLGLVASIAHKHKTQTLSFDDLVQEGIVGLIKGVDRFDVTLGYQFSTYASYWIKQAITRLINRQDRIVRLPVALAEKASVVFEAMRSTYLQSERWPSLRQLTEQVQANSDLTADEIKTIYSYYQATHSLDAVYSSEDNDGLELMSRLKQQQFSLPLDAVIERNFAQYINQAVDSLPDKEATILSMRFGLKNQSEMTLQAVADHLQVTRERVRQIQNQALGKLKQQFGFELELFLEPNDSY